MALLAALCVSCSGVESGNQRQQLVVTGSSTLAPLIGEIGKRFESLYPEVRIDVHSGGSSRGIADTRRGLADIGMVSRQLNHDEQDLIAVTIARDGVCVIVHRDNPITALTNEQIVGIYTGTIDNWQAVGGSDAPITVVNKAEGRSTLELFLNYFKLSNRDVQADIVIGDNEQGIKSVAGDRNAIGYVSVGTAQYDAEHGVSIKLLPLAGVAASIQKVISGDFSLARPLNLVTRSKPEGLVKQFLAYARSADVQELIEEQYFVPLPQ